MSFGKIIVLVGLLLFALIIDLGSLSYPEPTSFFLGCLELRLTSSSFLIIQAVDLQVKG